MRSAGVPIYSRGNRGIYCGIAAFFIAALAAWPTAAAASVLISEIMWDGLEYIELHNPTAAPLAIGGWQLTRQQPGAVVKVITTFADGTLIAADGYYLIEKTEATTEATADLLVPSLTLVQAGEQLKLVDDAANVVDTANQLGAWFAGANTTDGVAMERTSSADGTLATSWHTSTGMLHGRSGTPGEANSAPAVNTVPVAAISGPVTALAGESVTFSAEDSTDADNDTLTYLWSFGGSSTVTGIEAIRTFTAAGTQVIRLTVSDGEAEAEATHTLVVSQPSYSDQIVINEYLPNPVGSDTTSEFIELKNTGSATVVLAGWQLDDAEGGSKPYTIPAGVSLPAGAVRAFMRSETKIALNNDTDSVRLLDPSGVVKFATTYTSSTEGHSYNRTSGTIFVASTTITPGQPNVITTPTVDDEDEDEAADDEETASSSARAAGTSAAAVPLADIREEELGTVIKTEGIISAPPGVLGKQVLYLAGSGAQVYFSKAEWPNLKLGDRVAVTGTLSSNRGETRLKLASVTDIAKVNSGDPPVPHRVETGDVGEAWEGSLVIIQGQVTETNGDTFYVDDGSGEVRVVIGESTKIDKPKMSKGTDVTITGIVSETTSGYRILPRFQEDVRLGLVAGLTSFPATGLLSWLGLTASVVVPLLAWARSVREPLLFGIKG